MPDRYRVTLTPDGQGYGILDRKEYDYCGLPGDDGQVLELRWKIRSAAEAWLRQCYLTWQAWEGNGQGIPPKGWRPLPPKPSPWDRGIRYYS